MRTLLVTDKTDRQLIIMYASSTNTTTTPVSTKWEELTLTPKLDLVRLHDRSVKLDLLLLALKSLAAIGIDALGRVASQLQLESAVADKLTQIGVVCGEVSLDQARKEKTDSSSTYSSLPEEEGKGRKINEARSLVLIICHLARQHQSLIRRAVALMEQSASQNSDTATLLKDYSDRFNEVYRRYFSTDEKEITDEREKLAFKLLIDLLFCSDSGGHRRLWFTLLSG